MSLKHFLPGLALALIALTFSFVLWAGTRNVSAQVAGPIYQMTTASSTSVTTSSKSIAATSTGAGARFRELVNLSGASIYCAYNDVSATFSTGFIVPASSTKQWYGDTLYTGAIRCIAPAAAPITFHEAY